MAQAHRGGRDGLPPDRGRGHGHGAVARLARLCAGDAPAMQQAAALLPVDLVLADAGYDGEHNHRLCRLCREVLGVRETVIKLNRRRGGRRWPTAPYRRAMRRRFPTALSHQRWHAERVFSRHKRRLGAALTARRPESQQREIILRVLTHNLMLLKARA